jgi:hypothetical protein
MAVASVNPVTCTGVDELVIVPSPRDPDRLRPQHRTVLSDFKAHEKLVPALTAVTDARPLTVTGVDDADIIPFPS